MPLFYKKLFGFKRLLLTPLSSNTDEHAATSDSKRHCPPFYSARSSEPRCVCLDMPFTPPQHVILMVTFESERALFGDDFVYDLGSELDRREDL